MVSGSNSRYPGLALGVSVALVLSFFLCATAAQAGYVKGPNVAGSFYPADPDELIRLIQKYLREAASVKPQEGLPLVLISPHAGYVFSGPVAAYGFKALSGQKFETVIILAASHYYAYKGASVFKEGVFRTPLGDVEIDAELASRLINAEPQLLFSEPDYFEREHSLEVELPFLQAVFKNKFKIVPVIMGQVTFQECRKVAQAIAELALEKSILVLASTDLSHYRTYEEALEYDRRTIDFIKRFDIKGLWDAVAHTGWNVCGIRPVVTSLFFAGFKGGNNVQILKYANSGDTAGDKNRVVGYLSAIISRENSNGDEDMLTREEKKRLLEVARASIEANLKGGVPPIQKQDGPGLNLKRGAFVTLHNRGVLRGCVGLFTSDEPLFEVVSKMAVQAARHDERFPHVTSGELKDLEIEISVLTEPELIDDWRHIRLGTDGVIIRKGISSGVFLPQVATETGWDLETFLGQLCFQKAGLPWDCFKDSQTKIYTFQALVFSEKDVK